MTSKNRSTDTDTVRGCPPIPVGPHEKTYQPTSAQPLDPASLKPPRGGSAIQLPSVPAPKEPQK